MKRISLRFAIVAAAAATMAALTAAPASAGTVLCESPEATCAQGKIKPAGNYLVTANLYKELGTGLSVESGIMKLSCTEELLGVKTSMRNGNPLPGTLISSIDASECSQSWFTTTCSDVTTNNPSTTITATKTGATVKIGSKSEPLTVSFFCDFNGEVEETCSFQATDAVTMTINEGDAVIEGASLTRTSGTFAACTYFSTPTLWLDNSDGGVSYVSQATETVLCGNAEVNPCPNSAILPAGTVLLTGALNSYEDKFTISNDKGQKAIECSNWGIGFDTTEDSGQPLPAEGSYGSVQGDSCYAFLYYGKRQCSDATVNTPDAAIEASSSSEATIEVGSAAQPLVFSVTCKTFEFTDICTYQATGPVTMEVEAGAVSISKAALKRTEGSFLCGPESTFLDMTASSNYGLVHIALI